MNFIWFVLFAVTIQVSLLAEAKVRPKSRVKDHSHVNKPQAKNRGQHSERHGKRKKKAVSDKSEGKAVSSKTNKKAVADKTNENAAPNKEESLPIKDKGDSEKEKIGLGEAIEGLSELLPKSETDEKVSSSRKKD